MKQRHYVNNNSQPKRQFIKRRMAVLIAVAPAIQDK
jgi:hypothetical protein